MSEDKPRRQISINRKGEDWRFDAYERGAKRRGQSVQDMMIEFTDEKLRQEDAKFDEKLRALETLRKP